MSGRTWATSSRILARYTRIWRRKSDLKTLRADVAADILTTRKELGEQIVGLRRAVIDYRTSVIGHGVIISEPEARVRRVEQHLNLPSLYPI
jgi:hypothetical protein